MRTSLETLRGKRNLFGCEVGVDWGVNARDMLGNLYIVKLFLVDCWAGERTSERAKKLLEGFEGQVIWLEKRSDEVTDDEIPRNSLDFCYIDGGHDYKTVKGDLEMYWPRVKKGGLFAGHDYMQQEGVHRAVNEFFRGKRFSFEEADCRDWWAVK